MPEMLVVLLLLDLLLLLLLLVLILMLHVSEGRKTNRMTAVPGLHVWYGMHGGARIGLGYLRISGFAGLPVCGFRRVCRFAGSLACMWHDNWPAGLFAGLPTIDKRHRWCMDDFHCLVQHEEGEDGVCIAMQCTTWIGFLRGLV